MNKQVLLVDDNADAHKLIRMILREEPIDLQSTTDPKYGLVLAGSMRPDLILLDGEMPEVDGYEFCRRMKADSSLDTVPIIFITGRAETDQKIRGLHLGAVDYITKPFSPGELLARVISALRTQSVITDLIDTSLVDTFTRLGNKKMFAMRLKAEASARSKTEQPLTCVCIKVDGFDSVTRMYGEAFADQMLTKVSDAIKATYRPEDVPCLMVKGEFAVLMPNTHVADAIAISNKFKTMLSRMSLTYRSTRVPVTCGIGIAPSLEPYDQSVYDRAVDTLEERVDRPSDYMALWTKAATSI